jgi:TniQ
MTLLRLPSTEPPLPHVLAPSPDESLLGYVFRLDAANDWEPGTIATMICTHRTGWKRASAAMWASGTIFDLRRLAGLADLPYEAITALTYLPDLRAATGDPALSVHALGDPVRLAFCPACLSETGTVPRTCLLPLLRACPRHRVRLVSYCYGHPPVPPGVSAAGRITCTVCGEDLGHVAGEPIDGDELDLQLDTWRAWSFLLGWRGDDIRGRGYRTIRAVRRSYPLRSLGQTISFERLVTVFLALQIEPAFVAELEDRPAAPCPNASCPRFVPPGPRDPLGRGRLVERHCSTCGARFIGRRILLCFDAEHGAPQPSAKAVRRAQRRLARWREALAEACRQDILAGRRITVTGTFRRAGVPANANLRATRLGLADLVRDAARRQRLVEGGEPAATVVTTMAEYRLIRDLARAGDWRSVDAAAGLGGIVPNERPRPIARVPWDRRPVPVDGVLDVLFTPRWAVRARRDPYALSDALVQRAPDPLDGRCVLSHHWFDRVRALEARGRCAPVVSEGAYPQQTYPERLEPRVQDFILGEWSPDWMPHFFGWKPSVVPQARPFG